jgi:pectate lyase-like protein
MPFTTVPDKAAGDIFTEQMWDTYIRDNLNATAPVYNVKDPLYGAKGDGSTNDTAAFQAAIAAVIATGGTLFIPSGNYLITSTLDFAALNGNNKTVRVVGSGIHHHPGYPGSNCILWNQASGSLFKAVGNNPGSGVIYPDISFEGFKVYVGNNQGAGVPTFDLQWPADGFSIKNVMVYFDDRGDGQAATGDGIRITNPQFGWTLENVVVWSRVASPIEGRGFVISDGHKADGTILNANLGTLMSGNGTLTSCLAYGSKMAPGYDFIGNLIGVTCNSVKAVDGGVHAGATGIRCIGPDTIRFNATHVEGPRSALRVESLVGVCTASNISYQGMIAGFDTSTVGVDQDSGKYCEYDVSFRGTFGNYAKFGTAASQNIVRYKPNPDQSSAVTPWVDNSTDKLNMLQAGSVASNAAGLGGAVTFETPLIAGGAYAPFGRLGQKLEIHQSANYGGVALTTWSATSSECPLLDLNRSKSATTGTQAAVASGDNLGALSFRGSDGTNFLTAVQLTTAVDGTVSAGITPGRLQINTQNSSGVSVERMRIDNRGNVILNASGSDLASNAVQGFTYIPRGSGRGTPAASYTGSVPMYWDTTAKMLYVYDGAWYHATAAAWITP